MSSILNNFFSKNYNSFKNNIFEVKFKVWNKLILNILNLLILKKYVFKFEIIMKELIVFFNPKITKINIINPRFFFKITDLEKFKKRFLPSEKIGYLILTTSKGLITHDMIKTVQRGGSLIGYFY